MNMRQEFVATFTEKSLGNATRCAVDRVFPLHPDPLPPGEGTADVRMVFCRRLLGKLRQGCDREAVDHSPSPRGEGRGEGKTESCPAHGPISRAQSRPNCAG